MAPSAFSHLIFKLFRHVAGVYIAWSAMYLIVIITSSLHLSNMASTI